MGVDVTSYIGYGTIIDFDRSEQSQLEENFHKFLDHLGELEDNEDGSPYEIYFEENDNYIHVIDHYSDRDRWFIGVYLMRFGDSYDDDVIELNDCFIKGIPKIAKFLEWYNAQPWAIPNPDFKLYGVQVWW